MAGGAAAALLVGAVAFRADALCLGIVLAVAVAWSWVTGASHLPVTVELSVDRTLIPRGDAVELTITATNLGRRALRSLTVDGAADASHPPLSLGELGASETCRQVFAVPCPERGSVTIGPLRLRRRDALGLVDAGVLVGSAVSVAVHARVTPMQVDVDGEWSGSDGSVRLITPSGQSFHHLREYCPGDDPRHIHWPSVARTGRLVVRQGEHTPWPEHHLVIAADDVTVEETLDVAVSMSAALLAGNARVSLWNSAGSVLSQPRDLAELLVWSSRVGTGAVAGLDVGRVVADLGRGGSRVTVIRGERSDGGAVGAAAAVSTLSAA